MNVDHGVNGTANCPNPDEWSAFTQGELPEDNLEHLAEHLEHCSACSLTLQGLPVGADDLVDTLRRPAEKDPYADEPACREAVLRLRTHGPMEVPAFSPPPQRIGPYWLLETVGAGNMGTVYKARHEETHHLVALKTLAQRRAGDATAVARFRREIEAVARLDHPNIIRACDAGEVDGVLYLVMDFVAGVDLGRLVRAHGRLAVADACELIRQAALGLEHAHRHRLVHRDVKPSNLLLSTGGEVKVLDLGLALPDQDETGLTESGQVLGTLDYMAPEQGQDSRAVDARSDLYGLGCTLYHLLLGRVPFAVSPGAPPVSKLWAHAYHSLPPLRGERPEISPDLEHLVGRLLAKDPAQRPASAAEVATALTPFAQGANLNRLLQPFREGRVLPEPTLPDAAAGRPRRIRRTGLVGAFLAVAGLLLLVGAVLSARHWLRAGIPHPSSDAPPDLAREPGNHPLRAPEPNRPPLAAPVVYPAALFVFEEPGALNRDLGVKVTDLLFARLSAKGELVLVDREDLKKTLAEAELNLSGAVRSEQATRVGQLTGARLLITGSIIRSEKKLYLVVKVIGTETGRMAGVSVDGQPEDLDVLVGQLAEKLTELVSRKSGDLVARVARVDRVATLKELLDKERGRRPTVMVKVNERHTGAVNFDPAAQTELVLLLKATGFEVIDPDEGMKTRADVVISGEGVSSFAARHGNLVTMKARLEVTAVDQVSGKVLGVDRQTAVVVDLTEPLAGKAALQEAAAILAERLLPKLVQK
jgi:hypothetical protein